MAITVTLVLVQQLVVRAPPKLTELAEKLELEHVPDIGENITIVSALDPEPRCYVVGNRAWRYEAAQLSVALAVQQLSGPPPRYLSPPSRSS